MSRALWLGILAGYLLSACGDGSLQAFEPQLLALGGGAGRGSEAEAGRGATAGASAGAGAEVPASPLVIDDFEDGDPRANKPLGWWYPFNDNKTLPQGFGIEPASRGTSSIYALRTHGSGFVDWGSGVGVDLVGEAAPLDLLSYDELCFMARVEAGSSTAIQVHLLRGTLHYATEASISETWNRYCLPLTDFMTTTRDALVPQEITSLQFFFTPTDPFFFWLDDVEVVRD